MKIGILTVTGDNNYGNKLQNYALQEIICNLGFDVETIRVENNNYMKIVALTYVQHIFRGLLPVTKRRIIERRMCFLRFNKHIKQGFVSILKKDTEQEIIKKLMPFDYLLYGSDQIWNPDFPQFSVVFLGEYAPKEKNIAVSASIGRSSLPDEYVEIFRKGIQQFKAISVREADAQNILKKLSNNIESTILIDPTLMLDKEKWTLIEREIDIPENYCVIYFLGKADSDYIESFLEKNGCNCINIGTDKVYGPGEFIYLIRNAEFVITDSFHASIFSLLFGVELHIRNRRDQYVSMNSRIVTLLDKLGITPKTEKCGCIIRKGAINDKQVQSNLNNEREKFNNFLKNNIDI